MSQARRPSLTAPDRAAQWGQVARGRPPRPFVLDQNGADSRGRTRWSERVVLSQGISQSLGDLAHFYAVAAAESTSQVSIGDDGRGMMRGEFESMRALHETAPDLAPKPIAWGTFSTAGDVHFFLCDFYDMDAELCSLDTFPAMLAGLHRRGAARNNGKFGFPVTTYQGRLAQDMTWCHTWEESFSRNLDLYFDHELEAQGSDEEIGLLRRVIMERVVPRLLRPMETGGRRVTPTLIHGDLVRN